MTQINPHCCPELAEKISAFIDEELTIEIRQEVEVHLVNCSDCEETLKVELFIKQRLSQTSVEISAPNELVIRLREEISTWQIEHDST